MSLAEKRDTGGYERGYGRGRGRGRGGGGGGGSYGGGGALTLFAVRSNALPRGFITVVKLLCLAMQEAAAGVAVHTAAAVGARMEAAGIPVAAGVATVRLRLGLRR